MNMIKYIIKQKVKVLIFTLITFSSYVYSNNKVEAINVIGLEITKYNDRDIVSVCKEWKLSKDHVNSIFNLSKEYDYSPYSIFYQTPCDIVGEAKVGNKIWKYYINGGGIITLVNKNEEIFLGCEDKKCESFFILPFDGMNP